jgi:hypothetical protein
MKKYILASIILLTGCFVLPVFADDMSSIEAQCKQWAAEDQVPAEELEAYVSNCISEQLVAKKGEDAEGETQDTQSEGAAPAE